MSKPMIRIHNVETDEIIDREMTDEEIFAMNESAAALTALENANAAKVSAKATILEKLGLTEEEFKALS